MDDLEPVRPERILQAVYIRQYQFIETVEIIRLRLGRQPGGIVCAEQTETGCRIEVLDIDTSQRGIVPLE